MESMAKSQIKIMYVVLIALFLSACASTIKQQDLQSVKTVGVINNFPENPNFVTIGTTIFNNDYASIKDDKYSELLVKTVLDYVNAKGMIAKVIDESDRGSYDMVLELIPRDMYGIPGTFGFGVNQRSMFGNAMQANTYVALNIGPYINGKSKCSACYLQKIKPLNIDNLPENWEALSINEQKHVDEILSENIRETLIELLVEVGI